MHLKFCCLLLLVGAVGSQAHGDATWHTDEETQLTTIKMTVTPAPEPVPAFKHRLMTRPIDQRSGNAAIWLYRVFSGEGYDHQAKVRRNLETYGEDRYHSWIGQEEVPLGELPLDEVEKAFSIFQDELRNLREAAQRNHCDWDRGLEYVRGPDIIAVLLPEMQQMRSVARTLVLGTRLAIAQERYDDAIDLVRINHHMALHTAADPFLVSQLVGVAITGVGNRSLVELIAAPDSPNLYWALTELPAPMFDMRESIRFELAIGHRIFSFLRDAESAEYSREEWSRLWAQGWEDLSEVAGGPFPDGYQFLSVGMAVLQYGHAKQRLVDWGFDEDRVERMPVGQVLAIYSGRVYDLVAQEYEKMFYVSYGEANRIGSRADHRLGVFQVFGDDGDREVIPIASMLLPAVRAVRTAQARVEREITGLRVIEALRMHAAETGGTLPSTLSEITCVPVPENPVTGQPFVYYLEGRMGILEFPVSDRIHGDVRRYEITIR